MHAEPIACFEESYAKARDRGAVLIQVLALQDMMALLKHGGFASRATLGGMESRYEEACFEMTMETETPMRSHIESRNVYRP